MTQEEMAMEVVRDLFPGAGADAERRVVGHFVVVAALARAHAEGKAEGLEAAMAVCHAEWKELFGGSALDAGLDHRMRDRAGEAAVLEGRIRSLLAPLPGPLPAGEERPAAEEVKE